jgi:N-formylglutamate amidohydrolase
MAINNNKKKQRQPVGAAPFAIERPEKLTSPVVFASPHSGRQYPYSFLNASRLDEKQIRRSEDAFIEELFAAAPQFGAPLLHAHFPRAYVDANREAYELDPDMFRDPLPKWVNTTSSRVVAGLGTVARIVAGGAEIYNQRLDADDAMSRIEACHRPYHQALKTLIDDAVSAFGCCLVIDCHSMPSLAVSGINGHTQADIVLGDCHGSSCSPEISSIAERTLRDLGLSVRRNKPYAGGFTTRHYAARESGIQTLQIEINRALYMNEIAIERHQGFERLSARLEVLIARLSSIDHSLLLPNLAAE